MYLICFYSSTMVFMSWLPSYRATSTVPGMKKRPTMYHCCCCTVLLYTGGRQIKTSKCHNNYMVFRPSKENEWTSECTCCITQLWRCPPIPAYFPPTLPPSCQYSSSGTTNKIMRAPGHTPFDVPLSSAPPGTPASNTSRGNESSA